MYTSEYPIINLTADVVVLVVKDFDIQQQYVLLVQRGKEPFKGLWALPGGFINPDEDTRTAAAREVQEETGLELNTKSLVLDQVANRPDRDPRGRTISIVYQTTIYLTADEPLPEITGSDDAADAIWCPVEKLDGMVQELAFDHYNIFKGEYY